MVGLIIGFEQIGQRYGRRRLGGDYGWHIGQVDRLTGAAGQLVVRLVGDLFGAGIRGLVARAGGGHDDAGGRQRRTSGGRACARDSGHLVSALGLHSFAWNLEHADEAWTKLDLIATGWVKIIRVSHLRT